jgi:Thrombospondin type 3 repeat/RTX calcium-binding nonapeptide repeat (4 copies)
MGREGLTGRGGLRGGLRLLVLVVVPAALFLTAPSAASAFTCPPVTDDFNRADSDDLGPGWIESNGGGLAIVGNELARTSQTQQVATRAAETGEAACADIEAGGEFSYVAFVFRQDGTDTAQNVYIQIGDGTTGATAFDTASFFIGIGGSGGSWNGSFATLTPFASGRVYVAISGSTGTLQIDTTGDDNPEQTIPMNGVPTNTGGTDTGLGIFGDATADNYALGSDADSDGVFDGVDNCQTVANPDQADNEGDGIGDACDPDDDNDNVPDSSEFGCPHEGGTGIPTDTDSDDDGVLDDPDAFPCDPDETADTDADNVGDNSDNCPFMANSNQADNENDGIGDVCDPDDDNDTVDDVSDNCATTSNMDQANNDGDSQGDVCDPNDDNDALPDATDGCPTTAATTDANGDGCPDPPPPAPLMPTPLATAATCSRENVTIAGTPGADTLTGTSGRDVIAGFGGRDVLKGLGGDDVICGNPGGDKIRGGSGDDLLRGGRGRDSIRGGPGKDTINPDKGSGRGPKDLVVQ